MRPYLWRSFTEAIAFVNEVAAVAEAARHHPDIDIRYRAVTVRLVTHDAGGTRTGMCPRPALSSEPRKALRTHEGGERRAAPTGRCLAGLLGFPGASMEYPGRCDVLWYGTAGWVKGVSSCR